MLHIKPVFVSITMPLPLSANLPYRRFEADTRRIDTRNPQKATLNADGFTAGLFGVISKGSMSSGKSFALLHPAFLNQVHLNRHGADSGVLPIVGADAIIGTEKKGSVWLAGENLLTSTGAAYQPKPGYRPTIVRVGIKRANIEDGGATDPDGSMRFTLAQLRLICKNRTSETPLLSGSGQSVWPIGYMKAPGQVQLRQLGDDIYLTRSDFAESAKYIDFVFEIPVAVKPVVIEFRANAIARLSTAVSAEEGPEVIPFIQTSKCASDIAELAQAERAKIYGLELSAGAKLLEGFSLSIDSLGKWQEAESPELGVETRFGEITKTVVYARTNLIPPSKEDRRKRGRDRTETFTNFAAMLGPLDEYKLLALKCNNPPVGQLIEAEQFPVLIDLDEVFHHAVGLVAAGQTAEEETIYQVDYCSLGVDEVSDGLIIAEDGSVTQPFPNLWLTEQVESITELYVLYLVKISSPPVIITSVHPANSKTAAGFQQHEGFLVRER